MDSVDLSQLDANAIHSIRQLQVYLHRVRLYYTIHNKTNTKQASSPFVCAESSHSSLWNLKVKRRNVISFFRALYTPPCIFNLCLYLCFFNCCCSALYLLTSCLFFSFFLIPSLLPVVYCHGHFLTVRLVRVVSVLFSYAFYFVNMIQK